MPLSLEPVPEATSLATAGPGNLYLSLELKTYDRCTQSRKQEQGQHEGTYVRVEDTRIAVTVTSRECDFLAGRRGSLTISANADLSATGIELSTAFAGGKMEGDDLVTNEIIPGLEITGKIDRDRLPVD